MVQPVARYAFDRSPRQKMIKLNIIALLLLVVGQAFIQARQHIIDGLALQNEGRRDGSAATSARPAHQRDYEPSRQCRGPDIAVDVLFYSASGADLVRTQVNETAGHLLSSNNISNGSCSFSGSAVGSVSDISSGNSWGGNSRGHVALPALFSVYSYDLLPLLPSKSRRRRGCVKQQLLRRLPPKA